MNQGETGLNIPRDQNIVSEEGVIGFLTKVSDIGSQVFYVTRRTLEVLKVGMRIKIGNTNLGTIESYNRVSSSIKTTFATSEKLRVGSKVRIQII